MNNKLSRAIALAVLGLSMAAPHAVSAADATVAKVSNFDLPPQSLAESLRAVATETKTSVLFDTSAMTGRQAPALKARLTVDEAIGRLLIGSGLTFQRLNDKTIVLAPTAAGKAGSESAPMGGRTEQDLSGNDISHKPDALALMLAQAGAADEAKSTAQDTRSKKTTSANGGVEEMIVEESRVKPYQDANADIPRTVDDHQPYYIFDSQAIKRSGAYNIEDFLKQKLTMNTVVMTNGQKVSTFGNTSSFNLRGVGTDKTLILVNGRRRPGLKTHSLDGNEYQPDINGIPLSAIERIEVLPTSASGIYGGSAMGGVINVILKRDYTGGEVQVGYDNVWDTDSSKRSASASYGFALEGGKTHLSTSVSWADAKPLLLQDRVAIYKDNFASIQSRSPEFIYSSSIPWLGVLPNIAPNSSTQATLTLKNNGNPIVLNSRNTHVPAGTSPGISMADLTARLAANAGRWNLEFPNSTQSPTGLLRPFGATPEMRSLQLGMRRQMLPRLELFADFSFNENYSRSINNPMNTSFVVRANAPTNPFTTDILITFPSGADIPMTSRSQNRSVTFGALAQLPGDWSGALDYTWSENRFNYSSHSYSSTRLNAGLLSGLLNPFVDSLLYPQSFQDYLIPLIYQGANRLDDVALRLSGPLPSLPWGAPSLTAGLERRTTRTPERATDAIYPYAPENNNKMLYYKRESITDSLYFESTVPLVRSGWLPLMHTLDLQLSGRNERYVVDNGTVAQFIYLGLNPPFVSYQGTTLNGRPYFSQATYNSNNYTLGLKYQPIKELTLRVSRATAFLPPQPDQLLKNPLQSTDTTPVNDPKTGQINVPVYTLGGGNPDLKPENSKSVNAGIIWEPLNNLRFNAEYYKIERFDAIGGLSAQDIVRQESAFPDRITRNSDGRITLVDTSYVNLYHRSTEGWDVSANYSMKTDAGRFSLNVVESIILNLKDQYSQTLPEYDAVNFPSEGGAGKYKANATLNWEWRQWIAAWTVRYFGAYKQYGAFGGPVSTQFLISNPSADLSGYSVAQGSSTVPAQAYHDFFLSYAFDSKGSETMRHSSISSHLLQDLTVQFGMRNVFNKIPPLDVYYSGNYFLSPYGDTRLRSYWLSLTKTF